MKAFIRRIQALATLVGALGLVSAVQAAALDAPPSPREQVTATTASEAATSNNMALHDAQDAKPTRCAASMKSSHAEQMDSPDTPLSARCSSGDMDCWKKKCCLTVGWPECCN
ncbi:MAG: hypothetical protein EOP38_04645 [Rubrivivax sp.]|nr:MAG: hypothetical protein EOP38_04645 [Rubrivivax sp.]